MKARKRRSIQHSMQGIFVFLLLGLFAVMSTLMVLLGAQMYHNTVDQTAENNEDRMLSAYVRSMVRAQDAAGAVAVEEQAGLKTLALHESLEGEEYVTWLYCYDNQLYEQFTSLGHDFEPEAGTAICPATSFDPQLENDLLTVNMADGTGERFLVQVALRCAQ